jgi:hypothetical protein
MIVEGIVKKRGFMAYDLDTGKERTPIYAKDGSVFKWTKPSWNTFAGLAKDGRKVKIEGYFQRTLTLKGMKNAFFAVRFV